MEFICLSTVTPVYRGAEYLHEMVNELDIFRKQLVDSGSPLRLAESIFVDDGSVDGSGDLLAELSTIHEWIQVIHLSRNFGQHPATMAGILHTSGDWIATLDEDLQHHPRDLLKLLAKAIIEKHDVIYANPEFNVHKSVYRDWCSRCYKRLIAILSGNPHVVYFNSFRMMRASIGRAAAAVAAHQTYFDIAVCWFTTRIGSIVLPLKDNRFVKGGSGYSFRSLLTHARRMLESSEVKALRIAAVLGILSMLLSIFMVLAIVALKLLAPQFVVLQGWASVMVAIFFFGGLISFLSSLILEFLSLLIIQSHGKPTFFEIDRSRDEILCAWFTQQKPKE